MNQTSHSKAFTAFVLAMLLTAAVHGQDSISLIRCGRLPAARNYHGSAVVGKRLYVVGGWTDTGLGKSCISAELEPGHKLGTWREELALPENRSWIGNAVQVVNDKIYIIGGSVMPFPGANSAQSRRATDALWTTVRADGTLTPWQRTASFPSGNLSAASTCASDANLYIIGGNSDRGQIKTVLIGDLDADGSLKSWRQGTSLPFPLWFHGTSVVEDHIYVWGGLKGEENTTINMDVLAAQVGPDGTIGQWEKQAPMPQGIYQSAFVGGNDYLVSVAGRYVGGEACSGIWYTRLANHKVLQWNFLKTDIETRMHHSLAIDRQKGLIITSGGQFRSGRVKGETSRIIDTVQAFLLPQPESDRLRVATMPGPNATAGPRFLKLNEALAEAGKSGKPVLAYLYSPQVPASRRFWDSVLTTPEFAKATSQLVLAAADVSGDDAAAMSRYSTFRIPAMVLLKPDGTLTGRAITLRTMDDVKNLLAGQANTIPVPPSRDAGKQ